MIFVAKKPSENVIRQGWCKVGKKLSLFAPALRKVKNELNTTIARYFYLCSATLHKKKSKYA